jgi:hypothetical protein
MAPFTDCAPSAAICVPGQPDNWYAGHVAAQTVDSAHCGHGQQFVQRTHPRRNRNVPQDPASLVSQVNCLLTTGGQHRLKCGPDEVVTNLRIGTPTRSGVPFPCRDSRHKSAL